MTAETTPGPLTGLRLLPVASPPTDLVRAVMVEVSRRLAVPCRLLAPDRDLVAPVLAGREQVDADGLLEQLERLTQPVGEILVGLTSLDIGHPIFTYFFGRARHFGPAALVSCARLTPTFYGLPDDLDVTVHRTVYEILHELGHLVGLEHCEDYGCLLHFAPSVEAIDNRGVRFCAECSRRLPEAFRPLRTADDGF